MTLATATENPSASHATARRLLVVDDDPLSRSLQARLLGLLGHRALVVEAPADALDAALGADIDGMLLDLGMPEVDGFTLLSQLRAAEARLGRRPLPVIAVTGYAASTDRLRCLMAGFNDHLCKPIDVHALGASLQRHLPAASDPAGDDNDARRVEAAARRLAQVRPNSTSFAPTLLEAFAMRSGQMIEEIAQAQQLHDCAALRHAVKSLKASAEFMGATGLGQLCDRLQQAADQQDHERAGALVKHLVEEHQSVLLLLLQSQAQARAAA